MVEAISSKQYTRKEHIALSSDRVQFVERGQALCIPLHQCTSGRLAATNFGVKYNVG